VVYVSYFERCQDWLLNGEAKSPEALNGALQGIERKLAALSDRETDDYQDLECTVGLLQEQLALVVPSVPSAEATLSREAPVETTTAVAEPALDSQGLHPAAGQPINLTPQQKVQALENLLSNPLLAKGMPKG
jgi:hypothetical protein